MNRLLVLFIAILTLLCNAVLAQGKLDTLYLNKDFRVSTNRHFAEYMFVTYEPEDTVYAKEFRCFYSNGAIHSQGEYQYIDKIDANRNIYNNERIVYNKKGEVSEHYRYRNGLIDGWAMVLKDDGAKMYTEYDNGSKVSDFSIIEYPSGLVLKYDPIQGKYIKDTPDISNVKKVMYNDNEWQYYTMNGILIGVSVNRVKEYGRYIQLSVIVANYTLQRFDFGVRYITNSGIETFDMNNKSLGIEYCEAMDANQYLSRVKNRQRWNEVAAGMLIGLSSATAELSGAYNRTITTQIESPYREVSINTTYYDSFAQQQHNQSIANAMTAQSNKHNADLERFSVGYLRENTIFPDSEISGYIMIPDDSYYSSYKMYPQTLHLSIEIDGVEYPFIMQVKR